MIILGLSHLSPSHEGHDTTAALFVDGILKAAISEERFTRIKHHAGYPSTAIQYCLNEAGIRLSDVDRVAVGYGLPEENMDETTKQKFSSCAKFDGLFDKTPIENKNPIYYNHHYIHARMALSMTNFNKAVIISLDGAGIEDGKSICGGVYIANNGNIETIKQFPVEASLGAIYSSFTQACGFQMADGEGKTMSLAAFGENESDNVLIYSKVKEIFPTFNGLDYVSGGIKLPYGILHNNKHLARYTDERMTELKKRFKVTQLAWAVQKILEEIVIELVLTAVEFSGLKNVILTGGIFMNMIMNMKIRERLGNKNNLFFNPICLDLGNAVGAVFEQFYQETGKPPSFPDMPLYLGSSYDNDEVISALRRLNMKFEKINKTSTASDLISKGKIVGWFQGRSELGARALGNRSILSRVDDISFKDRMNDKIKKRENWRPFCPTILDKHDSHFLENPITAPYMILGFRMKNQDEAPAISHIDGTCRPQILSKSANSDFYDVVDGSGGIVLNTSLNLAGDPIIETPTDALMTFKNSEMDALIINDFLVKR